MIDYIADSGTITWQKEPVAENCKLGRLKFQLAVAEDMLAYTQNDIYIKEKWKIYIPSSLREKEQQQQQLVNNLTQQVKEFEE